MSVEVTLITEGTYPLYAGGVSVWCEQLVSGLQDTNFHVIALTGGARDLPGALPSNVKRVTIVPLWEGAAPRARGRRHFDLFEDAYAQLIGAMLSGEPDASAPFTRALSDLSLFAQEHDLVGALERPQAAKLLLHLWTQHATACQDGPRHADVIPRPSVKDALDAHMWLAHLLRPLATPTAPSDLSHAVSNGLSVLPALAAKSAHGTPFVLTEHGLYLRERYLTPPSVYLPANPRAFLLRFYRVLTRAAYHLADVISPASQFNLRWQLHLGADPDKLRPTYNGIDPTLFTVTTEEPPVPTISWVGRIDPFKDLETLIRAHALVQDRIPDARLRMFGSVPSGNEGYALACRALIRDLGLERHATFEGRASSVVDAFQAGHVVALTSISEGFPYTVIEAMATGRPMVATDVGGVREAVGTAGRVVTPRDPRAVADACLDLLGNDALRRDLGRQARERVLSMFTLQHCLDAYHDMYRDTRRLRFAPG